ncbi:hypothetical protein KGG77_gp17 [Streptomyces phage Omar]|uniref:Uncharacterized protein n=1 Tax=Streptomyces phage Omar TaxID=2059882 RepID=A0A2H5BLU1_9CAUD|nr:hypothetical protein KGG77_gp17 [Streptomyces phage Omar]AUG87251.1 hypothetical protein SEA_OMAR_67 [Streptomyces phage Omar]
MARKLSGWEYIDGRPRWAPTVEIQMAEILSGKYGAEYDEAKRELDNLVRAAQRDAAEALYERAESHTKDPLVAAGIETAADLIFPDYPEETEQ